MTSDSKPHLNEPLLSAATVDKTKLLQISNSFNSEI